MGLDLSKQSWKRTKLGDSHFLILNLLQSYSNQDDVVLAKDKRGDQRIRTQSPEINP